MLFLLLHRHTVPLKVLTNHNGSDCEEDFFEIPRFLAYILLISRDDRTVMFSGR